MPKERIRKSGSEGFADLLVQWGPDEIGPTELYQEWDGPRVRLFIIAAELGHAGSFMFHPTDDAAKDMHLSAGAAVGPIDIRWDRQQINRAIRVLRRARDQAYGKDE